MIRHIVLFKFGNACALAGKEAAIVKAFQSLATIPMKIENFSFGRTFTDRGQGYTHVLSLDLESKEALNEYGSNALHVSVINEWIKPNLDYGTGPLAMDIEL